uniref:Acyl-CoA dehydrogenase n=1 Tax=Rhabditophanes sp. KR3021 TaxID=114890 RepID=A0AC35U0D8_9BILA
MLRSMQHHLRVSKSLNLVRMTQSMLVNGDKKYKHAKTGGFTQTAPELHNPFTEDPLLEKTLRRILPQRYYVEVAKDLEKFGDRVVNEIDCLGRLAELNPPKLEHQNAWGERVDELVVTPAWYKLKEIAAEEGLIGIGYDDKFPPEHRRLHQFAKLYLFGPSSGLVTCPLAMTDGAAKTIKEMGLIEQFPEMKVAFDNLTSRDGKKAWTSGQWMTEKMGGSDVGSGTDTYARDLGNGKYALSGYKWFSSAIDANMCLTLARVIDKEGNSIPGSKGLSLFYLPIRDEGNKLNGIQMVRLKNKLGTRQLPTAELLLDGTKALKLSEEGRGIPGISNMLNVTRIHNAMASVSFMRRIISLARDYSKKRIVFGREQSEWPLHVATIAKLEVECRAGFLFLMEAARLLGLSESGKATPIELLNLRLITPVLKLYTAKKCVPLISEGIECFGGQGYMEDTGLPTILRDAQVTPIWEGTTNVLSLDVLRVFGSKDNILGAFEDHINSILPTNLTNQKLVEAKAKIEQGIAELKKTLHKVSHKSITQPMQIDLGAREVALTIGNIYCGTLLLQQAASEVGTDADIEVVSRYVNEKDLVEFRLDNFISARSLQNTGIVFENFDKLTSKL